MELSQVARCLSEIVRMKLSWYDVKMDNHSVCVSLAKLCLSNYRSHHNMLLSVIAQRRVKVLNVKDLMVIVRYGKQRRLELLIKRKMNMVNLIR